MEIHPPEGPVHSFRAFVTHIAIVTVGILIALALQGVRESISKHVLLRETRESFRTEFEGDRGNLKDELEGTRALDAELDKIVADIPGIRQHPEQLAARLKTLAPTGYFFSSSSWDTALSTGGLGNMKVTEARPYSDVNFLIREYSSLEATEIPAWFDLKSYVESRPALNPADLDVAFEKLLRIHYQLKAMVQVGEEFQHSLDEALSQS